MRVLLIGEGLAFVGAMQAVFERGHIVAGLFATSADEADTLRRSGHPVAEGKISPAAFVAGHDCDLLLSIANSHRLDPATLARPRLAAVNYHNAPLPAYAGLRATSWAILNGETSHGITWHHMLAGIDTGDIIVQRRFALAPDETTGSLNARCTAAALDSIGDVLNACANGDSQREPQERDRRSYFSRSDIVPNAGLIDWRWPADRILRLIRACDWGANASDFGTATIAMPHGPPLFALSGEGVESAGAPGTIIATAECALTIACGDGAVRLELDRPSPLRAGAILPSLEGETLEVVTTLHRRALLAERQQLGVLESLNARLLDDDRGTPPTSVATAADQAMFVRAVGEVLGADSILAMAAPETAAGLLQDWIPVRCGDGLADMPLPLPRDVAHRHPKLAGLSGWPGLAAARLLREGQRFRLPSGGLAFTPDGRMHHRLPADVAAAILDAMARPRATAHEGPPPSAITSIHAQAMANPGAPAIEYGARTTSRGELAALSATIARRLADGGLQPEAGIGVLLPRGADFVAAALGAMQAGGAYVPLGLASPPERRLVEIEEAGITHLIASEATIAELELPSVELLAIE